MGKLTYKGFVPKDDPMFSTGPELFSRPRPALHPPTSTKGSISAAVEKSDAAAAEPEMPTLKFVMSLTEYEWSVWIKSQPQTVINHLKALVACAPPSAARAAQIKLL